jgi:DNA polymerase III epsilon subunit-like protein
MSKQEIYISIDIETDGECPGVNSMLSLGAVAFTKTGGEVDDFYRTVEPIPDVVQSPETMEWWMKPENYPAYLETLRDQRLPGEVMAEFAGWLRDLNLSTGGKLVAAAWPAAFDFGFVNWYMHNYYGTNPLGFACLDIRSYANGLFMTPGYYKKISEGDLYSYFKINTEDIRPHFAVDDARKQGRLLMALLKYAEDGE